MTIYLKIKPTVLMVKKHKDTGLLYFCKTTRIHQAYSYKGSGVRWKHHLKKHGANISTLWVSDPYVDASIKDDAINFSILHDVVNSKVWANLVIEDGLFGGSSKWTTEKKKKHKENETYKKSDETKRKISEARGGFNPEKWKSKNKPLGPGRGSAPKSEEHKLNIKKSLTKLTTSQIEYLQTQYKESRGEKSRLAREWGCSIDQITRWVGSSFKHKR